MILQRTKMKHLFLTLLPQIEMKRVSMTKMLRMFLVLDNNIKLTQLTSDLELNQRELALLASISLTKLLDQLMLLRKLRRKNLMIMKSLTAPLTTATHK